MTASISVTPTLSGLFTAPTILIRPARPLPGCLSSFSKFGELPIEIRLAIWSLMLPGPRLVLLREEECGTGKARLRELEEDPDNQPTSPRDRAGRPGIAGPFQWGFRSPCPVPTLLQICHESRSFASQYYKRCFGHVDRSEALTYFRSDIDILYIDRWLTEKRKTITGEDQRVKLRDFSHGALDHVTYLAVEAYSNEYLAEAFGLPPNDNVRRCPNVKVLCVIRDKMHYDIDEPNLVLLENLASRMTSQYKRCEHTILSTMRRGVRGPCIPYIYLKGEGMPESCFAEVAPLETAKKVIKMKEIYYHKCQRLLGESVPSDGLCGACEKVGHTRLRVGECLYEPAAGDNKCFCVKSDILD